MLMHNENKRIELVSVGIPVYKELYFEKALTSVINQTYKNLEIIIINDSSPYNIEDIISKFSDPRIQYHKNEKNIGNNNLVAVWNQCLSYATGEFFVLFSDDDIMEINYIDEMLANIKAAPDYDVYRCRVNIIDQNDKILSTTPEIPSYETALDYLIERLKGNRQHYIPEVIFRRSKLLKSGGFVDYPLAWYSDEATCFLVGLENGLFFVDKVLFNWRYSSTNISKMGNYLSRVEAGILYKEWLAGVLKENCDKITCEDISRLAKTRIEQNKKNVLIRTARQNIFLGTLDIFKNGFVVRKKFGMSFFLIAMAVLSFIKNYSRGKN